MKSRYLCAAFVLVALGSSVGSSNAIAQDRFGLAGQPQVYLIHQTAKNPFLIQGTGYRLAAGPIASIVQANESAGWQQKMDLRDPVNYLKDRLADALRRDLKLANLQIQTDASDLPITSEGLSEEALAAKAPTFRDKHPNGAVIEVVTRHWGVDNDKIKYFASVWVTDLSQSKRLLATSCSWVILDAIDKKKLAAADPNFDPLNAAEVENRLLAENGSLLKARLRKAAELCADKVAGRFSTGRENKVQIE